MFNEWQHIDPELFNCDKETIIKAFKLFVEWAEKCDNGYDSIACITEKYQERLEEENYGYTESLLACALWEALGEE